MGPCVCHGAWDLRPSTNILAHNCRNSVNIATTLSNRHQFRQCWEFCGSMLGEFEKVPVKSVTTPFLSLPVELQRALMVNHNLCDVDLTEKAIQRVSEVTVNNVKYAVRDVFVIDVLHSERISLFWQIKYIFNIGSFVEKCWFLCPMTVSFMHAVSRLIKNGLYWNPEMKWTFWQMTLTQLMIVYVTVRHCV